MSDLLELNGDTLYLLMPVEGHPNVCQRIPIMTKEIFTECYKQWIQEGRIDGQT